MCIDYRERIFQSVGPESEKALLPNFQFVWSAVKASCTDDRSPLVLEAEHGVTMDDMYDVKVPEWIYDTWGGRFFYKLPEIYHFSGWFQCYQKSIVTLQNLRAFFGWHWFVIFEFSKPQLLSQVFWKHRCFVQGHSHERCFVVLWFEGGVCIEFGHIFLQFRLL